MPTVDCRLPIDSGAIRHNAFSIDNRQSAIGNRRQFWLRLRRLVSVPVSICTQPSRSPRAHGVQSRPQHSLDGLHPYIDYTQSSKNEAEAFYTDCSSFVEENVTACHSEQSEESPHLEAQTVRKKCRGCFVRRGGLSMTDPKVVLARRGGFLTLDQA